MARYWLRLPHIVIRLWLRQWATVAMAAIISLWIISSYWIAIYSVADVASVCVMPYALGISWGASAGNTSGLQTFRWGLSLNQVISFEWWPAIYPNSGGRAFVFPFWLMMLPLLPLAFMQWRREYRSRMRLAIAALL